MSWIADQFGMLFSVQDRVEVIELQRQKITRLEMTIGEQLRTINALTDRNLQLESRCRQAETDLKMVQNALNNATEGAKTWPGREPDRQQNQSCPESPSKNSNPSGEMQLSLPPQE